MRLTAENLVRAISNLPRDREYHYIDSSNKGLIKIISVELPEGPVTIKRYNPHKGETLRNKKEVRISVPMIWRLANSIAPGKPINVDRVYGGSYNTRSVFEALLAHTPQFYTCMPGRIEFMNTSKKVKPGHKHLLFLPDEPHENAKVFSKDVKLQISEINVDAVYEQMELTANRPEDGMDIEQSRRHAQIQIALVLIGQHLNYRTWVAANDRSIEYAGKRISEFESVIDSLTDERVLSAYHEAAQSARLIDCIWFRNGRLMPAVMEIEHSTGVTSGLTRMKNFYDSGPPLRDIRWTIVAPDQLRTKVVAQANLEQFKPMSIRFFPYSAVEELYSLCQRRNPKGITDEFLDCFMEKCVNE